MWLLEHLRISMLLVSMEMALPMILGQQGHSSFRPDLSSLPRMCNVRHQSSLGSSLTYKGIYMRINALATVDRTIVPMNRSSDPLQLEAKLRERRRTDPSFSFLNPSDHYHPYYRNRLDSAMSGNSWDGVPFDTHGY